MFIKIIPRHSLKNPNHFAHILEAEDFDISDSQFLAGDTILLNLQTNNPDNLGIFKVKSLKGIRLYDSDLFPKNSLFQYSVELELRVIRRNHHIYRKRPSIDDPAQYKHSVTILVKAISDDVERLLAKFLEILAIEEGWGSMALSEGNSLEDEHKNELD